VHEAGFIHRDVCPRNFVCSKDATSLTLIDFGSRFRQKNLRRAIARVR
jgi:tRNA A-37 threonylcarbamoyl transferase component Bud32